MVAETIQVTENITLSLTPKMKYWLRCYLDESNPETFLNGTASAQKCYAAKSHTAFTVIACENLAKLSPLIEKWLDEQKVNSRFLKEKLLHLINARETKFEKIKGSVNPETLPPHVSVLTTTDITTSDPDTGETRTLSGDTLLGIEVNALETQRKTLDMAFRVKGMYAPEKHAVLTKGDLTVHVETGSEVRALLESVAISIFGRKED